MNTQELSIERRTTVFVGRTGTESSALGLPLKAPINKYVDCLPSKLLVLAVAELRGTGKKNTVDAVGVGALPSAFDALQVSHGNLSMDRTDQADGRKNHCGDWYAQVHIANDIISLVLSQTGRGFGLNPNLRQFREGLKSIQLGESLAADKQTCNLRLLIVVIAIMVQRQTFGGRRGDASGRNDRSLPAASS